MLFTKKDKAGDQTEEGILEEAEDTEVEENVLEEESDDTEDDMSQESEISEGFILEKSDTATTALCLNGTKIRSGIPPMI